MASAIRCVLVLRLFDVHGEIASAIAKKGSRRLRDLLADCARVAAGPDEFGLLFRVCEQEADQPAAYEHGLVRFDGLSPALWSHVADMAAATRVLPVRLRCLRILGQLGTDDALPVLLEAVSSGRHEERLTALLALRDLGSAEAVRELLQLTRTGRLRGMALAALLTSTSPEVRARAIKELSLSPLADLPSGPILGASELSARGPALERLLRRGL
jgi:HEAT repeat protein